MINFSLKYVASGQSVHEVAPAVAVKVPASQDLQWSCFSSPTSLAHKPALHRLQFSCPFSELYCPAIHKAQALSILEPLTGFDFLISLKES